MSVPPGGYRWWYIDALSDDGREALTLIAFIGSVFSPYYRRARRNPSANAENHCAINVALYGGAKRWAMTERGCSHVWRDQETFTAGPSSLRWEGSSLVVRIDETCAPIPFRLRGAVRIEPEAFCDYIEILDSGGRHFWRPLCPKFRIEASFEAPARKWSGTGYLDSNWGDCPLEQGFSSWHWSRAALSDGAAILYDIAQREGGRRAFALKVLSDGTAAHFPPPGETELSRTKWRVQRSTRSEAGASVVKTLEDTPFYARSLVAGKLLGEDVVSVHESLSLDRFSLPVVQAMLPFRMPRRA